MDAWRLEIVLAVRGHQEFGEAGVFVGQIVLFLQIHAVHFLADFVEQLR